MRKYEFHLHTLRTILQNIIYVNKLLLQHSSMNLKYFFFLRDSNKIPSSPQFQFLFKKTTNKNKEEGFLNGFFELL